MLLLVRGPPPKSTEPRKYPVTTTLPAPSTATAVDTSWLVLPNRSTRRVHPKPPSASPRMRRLPRRWSASCLRSSPNPGTSRTTPRPRPSSPPGIAHFIARPAEPLRPRWAPVGEYFATKMSRIPALVKPPPPKSTVPSNAPATITLPELSVPTASPDSLPVRRTVSTRVAPVLEYFARNTSVPPAQNRAATEIHPDRGTPDVAGHECIPEDPPRSRCPGRGRIPRSSWTTPRSPPRSTSPRKGRWILPAWLAAPAVVHRHAALVTGHENVAEGVGGGPQPFFREVPPIVRDHRYPPDGQYSATTMSTDGPSGVMTLDTRPPPKSVVPLKCPVIATLPCPSVEIPCVRSSEMSPKRREKGVTDDANVVAEVVFE